MLPVLAGSTLVQLIFAVKIEVRTVIIEMELIVFMVSDDLLVVGILTPKTRWAHWRLLFWWHAQWGLQLTFTGDFNSNLTNWAFRQYISSFFGGLVDLSKLRVIKVVRYIFVFIFIEYIFNSHFVIVLRKWLILYSWRLFLVTLELITQSVEVLTFLTHGFVIVTLPDTLSSFVPTVFLVGCISICLQCTDFILLRR